MLLACLSHLFHLQVGLHTTILNRFISFKEFLHDHDRVFFYISPLVCVIALVLIIQILFEIMIGGGCFSKEPSAENVQFCLISSLWLLFIFIYSLSIGFLVANAYEKI